MCYLTAFLPRPKNILRPILPSSPTTQSETTPAPTLNEDDKESRKSLAVPIQATVKGGVVFKMLSRDTKGRV